MSEPAKLYSIEGATQAQLEAVLAHVAEALGGLRSLVVVALDEGDEIHVWHGNATRLEALGLLSAAGDVVRTADHECIPWKPGS